MSVHILLRLTIGGIGHARYDNYPCLCDRFRRAPNDQLLIAEPEGASSISRTVALRVDRRYS
jgi:hypothetical protein